MYFCLPSAMKHYQELKLNPFENSSLRYMTRPARPKSDALKFVGTAALCALLR
jgi:hypothetical protein